MLIKGICEQKEKDFHLFIHGEDLYNTLVTPVAVLLKMKIGKLSKRKKRREKA